jgi:hypothetical protein
MNMTKFRRIYRAQPAGTRAFFRALVLDEARRSKRKPSRALRSRAALEGFDLIPRK